MFGFLTDGIKAGLNVASDSFGLMVGEGDGPSKDDIAEALDAGLTIGGIAAAFGVGEDVIARILED